MCYKFEKTFAFTLAETLIVMGIIGVVAALTIPNLNSATADKEKVAKVQKLYSNLNDAFGRAQAVYGPFEEWFRGDSNENAQTTRFAERITEFMKVTKNCGMSTNQGCFSKGILYLNSPGSFNGWDDTDSSYYKVILADGTSVMFKYNGLNASLIMLDIDGPNKGAKKVGIDVFRLFVADNNIQYLDFNGWMLAQRASYEAFYRLDVRSGLDAVGWIIQNGNMDYLKTDDSGKCPNGKTILNATNKTCK